MIAYKIAYIAFVISFLIGNSFDENFQKSKVRIANYVIILVMTVLIIIGVN